MRTQPPPAARPAPATAPGSARSEEDQKILFQKYFKSVGPRTYVAQVKEARNGNHFIAITEGKRDKESGEVRKSRVLIFSEDYQEFFDLMTSTAAFVREHPVPADVVQKQKRFWSQQHGKSRQAAGRSG